MPWDQDQLPLLPATFTLSCLVLLFSLAMNSCLLKRGGRFASKKTEKASYNFKWATKKPSYFPLYWLVNRDPRSLQWCIIIVVESPILTQPTRVFFRGSKDSSSPICFLVGHVSVYEKIRSQTEMQIIRHPGGEDCILGQLACNWHVEKPLLHFYFYNGTSDSGSNFPQAKLGHRNKCATRCWWWWWKELLATANLEEYPTNTTKHAYEHDFKALLLTFWVHNHHSRVIGTTKNFEVAIFNHFFLGGL